MKKKRKKTEAERQYDREVEARIANLREIVRKGYEDLARKQAAGEANS